MYLQEGQTAYAEVNIKMPDGTVFELTETKFESTNKVSDIKTQLEVQFPTLGMYKLKKGEVEVNGSEVIVELMGGYMFKKMTKS